MKYLRHLIIFACGLTSCASLTSAPVTANLPLAGSAWNLKAYVQAGTYKLLDTVAFQPSDFRQKFTLRFADSSKFNGNAQCNEFFGNYATSSDTLQFGSFITTLVNCEPGVDIEDALGIIQTYVIQDSILTLRSNPSLVSTTRSKISTLIYARE